jgi:hypothetical protein
MGERTWGPMTFDTSPPMLLAMAAFCTCLALPVVVPAIVWWRHRRAR